MRSQIRKWRLALVGNSRRSETPTNWFSRVLAQIARFTLPDGIPPGAAIEEMTNSG